MSHPASRSPHRSRARAVAVAVARREAQAQARARLWLTGGGLLLALTLLALVALAPSIARAQFFNAESFTLDNGLQVVVVPNHRVPVVTHMVWYKVGAADEPPGKSGLAHVLEHMMFKGTDTIPPGQFSKIVARNGGRDNAFTSSDYTGYFQNIARDRLETVMEMEADRMANLRLAEDDFQTERDVVIEERLSRTENEPAALLGERLDQALWSVHPYRNPVIGWAHELAALTRQDALDFYDLYYAPNNAVVVIAGDITADAVRPMAERTYGRVPADHAAPARARVRDLPPPVDVALTMTHPRVAQASWWRRIIAPGQNTEHAELYAPLQVLAELLGGGPVSRLYDGLVMEQKVAVSAGAGYSGRAVDFGTFSLYATPAAGRTPAEVGAAVEAEIARLLQDGVTEAEVEGAKRRLKASVIYARDSMFGAARIVGAALATGASLDDIERWPDDVAAVTPDDVMEAARAVFVGTSSATAILQPQSNS
jgi:zinc protease